MSKHHLISGPVPDGAGPHVLIAIPTVTGQLHENCLHSLLESLFSLKIRFDVLLVTRNCHVDDARNACLKEFIDSEATDLLFIDSDVGFEVDAIQRIMSYDRQDVIAGVYPKKSDTEDYPVRVPPNHVLQADSDGLVEVHGAPTGFMRIPRIVAEKMLEAYKHQRFVGQSGDSYTVVFERIFVGRERMSGDYAFCERWRRLGGKVFVDPEIAFTHEGSKEWAGSLGDFWRKKHGVYDMLANDAIANMKAGNPTAESFVHLYKAWDNPWSPPPTYLAVVYSMAKKFGTVLECGSGLTTVVMAAAGAKVISLEHDPVWLSRVNEVLADHGLEADVRLSKVTDWYDPPKDDVQYQLVVIDGPPRKYGRIGVFTHMADKIKEAVIVMDDTDSAEYKGMLDEWKVKNGGTIQSVDDRFSVYLPALLTAQQEPLTQE